MKKSTNVGSWIAIVILSITAGIFIAIGVSLLVNYNKFMETAEKTSARITEIETYYTKDSDGDRVKKHRVYVEYTVDGERYETLLDSYDFTMKEGGYVDIYYNPADPGDVMSGSGQVVCYIMMGVGAVMLVVDIIIISGFIASSRKRKRLETDGTAYTGTIIDIRVITNIKVNGRHPYRADCEVIDPITQERYLFSSQNVYKDIRNMVGASVVVYVDNNDPSNHFVDIDRAIADFNAYTGTADYRR